MAFLEPRLAVASSAVHQASQAWHLVAVVSSLAVERQCPTLAAAGQKCLVAAQLGSRVDRSSGSLVVAVLGSPAVDPHAADHRVVGLQALVHHAGGLDKQAVMEYFPASPLAAWEHCHPVLDRGQMDSQVA